MFNIKNFTQEINSKGVMKQNTFMVNFRPPNNLSTSLKLERLSLRCEGAQIPGMSFASVEGMPRFGYGPMESNPYNVLFEDINLTFLVDTRGEMHKFFYEWTNSIVNYQSRGQSVIDGTQGPSKNLKTFEVAYKDDYVTDLNIEIYAQTPDTKGSNMPKKVVSVTAYRAYPKMLPSLDMSWASTNETVRLVIPFSYTDFKSEYFN